MLEAVKKDDAPVVSQLLKRGMDANSADAQGNSWLILAARQCSIGTLKALLDARAQIDARNALGETALMIGAINGHLEIVKQLLARQARVNPEGWTPLMYAAVKGDVNISRLLLEHGALINATAENGFTALMMAAREGHRDLVSFLLAKGADPNLKTDNALTALGAARAQKRNDIAELLVKAGAQ